MKRHSTKPFARIAIVAFFCTLLMGAGTAFADEQPESLEASVPAAVASEHGAQDADDATTSEKDAPIITVERYAKSQDADMTSDAGAMDGVVSDPTLTQGEPVEEPLEAMGTLETVDMYRLYNPNSGEHFYTGNWEERASLVEIGWQYEGIGWVAPDFSRSPVYRLYNPNAGDHHYTLSSFERDELVDAGWNDEGIGWYSDDTQRVAVLRQYNPNAKTGSHNFTTSEEEDEALADAGWQSEGVGWYAVSLGNTAVATSYIYLDAGHGKGSSTKGVYDSGAVGNGYEEAKLTAELVTLTAKYARELYGLKVYSNVNTNVEYWNRQEDALERGCTSLVSIHFNASDSGGTGCESYIHSRNAAPGATKLQSIMHEYLLNGTGLRDRGKKSAALAVCSGVDTDLPGTLLEVCFIDNSYDMKKYKERKDTIARELAAGLYEAAKDGF